jgi:hypothetical protein
LTPEQEDWLFTLIASREVLSWEPITSLFNRTFGTSKSEQSLRTFYAARNMGDDIGNCADIGKGAASPDTWPEHGRQLLGKLRGTSYAGEFLRKRGLPQSAMSGITHQSRGNTCAGLQPQGRRNGASLDHPDMCPAVMREGLFSFLRRLSAMSSVVN